MAEHLFGEIESICTVLTTKNRAEPLQQSTQQIIDKHRRRKSKKKSCEIEDDDDDDKTGMKPKNGMSFTVVSQLKLDGATFTNNL